MKNRWKQWFCCLFAVILALCSLTACGSSHCKEEGGENEVYEDGYCEYHYALDVAKDAVGDAAGDLMDSLLGG